MSSTKTNICFRCDGNSQIGLGHIYRCLALAEFLENDFAITFVLKSSSNHSIIPTNFNVVEIPNSNEISDELQFISTRFVSSKTIFVVDGYSFNEEYVRNLNEKFRLVYIDDLHSFKTHADLIINHTGGFQRSDFKALPLTQFCLGQNFAIIRKAFLKKQSPINFEFDLLICFGGADPENYTQRVYQESDQTKKIAIVIGTAYQFKDRLKDILTENTKIFESLDATGLSEIMAKSKIAITSASTVAYEYLAVSSGKLFVHQTAENQKYLFQFLIDSSAAKAYHLSLNLNSELNLDWEPNQIIDDLSPERLLKEFKLLELELLSKIRFAAPEDVEVVFNWANDKEVREQSFSQDKIEFEDHKRWFLGKIEEKSTEYFLIFLNEKPVGQIRFEIKNSDALISFLVSPDVRGMGWGSVILKKGIKQLSANRPEIKIVNGYVKQNNPASQKSFLRCNFKEEIANDEHHSFFYTLQL